MDRLFSDTARYGLEGQIPHFYLPARKDWLPTKSKADVLSRFFRQEQDTTQKWMEDKYGRIHHFLAADDAMASVPGQPLIPGFAIGADFAIHEDVLQGLKLFFLWVTKAGDCEYMGQYLLMKMEWGLQAGQFRNLPDKCHHIMISSILEATQAENLFGDDWEVPTTYGEVKYDLLFKGVPMDEEAIKRALSNNVATIPLFRLDPRNFLSPYEVE